MSELIISVEGFTIQPLINQRDGPCEIRWWYSRSFLDSNGVQVNWGTGTTGFWITTPCSIASGLITVDQDTLLWSTDDALDPAPASISLSAAIYSPRGKLIQQLQIVNKTQWIVPSSLAPTTTWEDFSIYNSAAFLANPPQVFLTASQTIALIDNSFDQHPASDTELGTVLLTIPADDPAQPIVWPVNDPLVRDAVKIQGVDIVDTAPLDTQALVFNQSNNQYEPTTLGFGTGNVISNEVSSVDAEVVVFGGTGGKTIRRLLISGLAKLTTGVLSAATAAVDYVAPGLITASGLTQTTGKLLGRSTASTGAIEEITVGTGLSLSAGTLSNTATDTGITQLTSDVVAGPGNGSQIATIPNDTVTYAKMQNVSAADRLLGRGNGGGSGDVQEIQLGTNLSMSGTTLNASAGTGTVGNVGTLTSNQLIIGQGGTDVAALGSLGTTVTVLHGNAGGAPTFGVVTPSDAAGNTTGSGNFALATSPTLVTPILGTPTSGTLTNCTGLPVSTGVGGLGSNVATFLTTPSSANLAAALTDETGSGANVFADSPSFTSKINLPNGTAPTTSTAADTAFDTNAWAASRGAIQVFDGTANTYVVAALASDTPTNGQVPTWNTGGTITWETPSSGGSPGGSNTQIQFNDSSAFGGDADFLWIKATNILQVGDGSTGAVRFGGSGQGFFSNDGTYLLVNVEPLKAAASSAGFVASQAYMGQNAGVSGGINMGTNGGYAFVNSTNPETGTVDTAIRRNAAGKLEIDDGQSSNLGSVSDLRDLLVRQYYCDQTITAGGTTGNQTINKAAGTVNIAAAGTTVTVTNSLCSTSSLVFAVIRTNDSTATIKNVVPGSGSFVINLTAAATAEISIGFFVVNK